jgi:predicted Zn-dependent protease
MCLLHGPHQSSPNGAGRSAQARNVQTRAELSRRGFVVMLVGTGGAALAGCVGPGETGLGLSLVPPEQVQELGLESWQRIRSEARPSDNSTYQRAARQVASDILAAAGENPAAWEVVVFEGDEANAFALPGGKIGIYEGMFRYAQNPDQLAAVIGHEIGHNQEAHAVERLNTAAATQGALQLIGVALQVGNIGYANEIAGLLGAGAQYGVILPYSRNQELEADRVGLFNMARAGYDPRAAIQLWQNMREAGQAAPEFLSTHPAPDARIAALQEMMPNALAVYQG